MLLSQSLLGLGVCETRFWAVPFILALCLIFIPSISVSGCPSRAGGVRFPGGQVQMRTAIVLDNRCNYSEHLGTASLLSLYAPTAGFVLKAVVFCL